MSEQNEIEKEVNELIFSGQKIAAITLHRAMTGMGLKESKETIEHLTNQLRLDEPERFVTKTGGGGRGCGMVILFGFVSVGALATYLIA